MKKISSVLLLVTTIVIGLFNSCAKGDIDPKSKTKQDITYKVGDYWPDPASESEAQGVVFWLDMEDENYDSETKSGIKGKIVSLDEANTTDRKSTRLNSSH